ncbi:hypothetical protein ACFZA7_52615 [Streptomyces mirabilis]|uniref:hypothetical protein n=1 Tax=Streptomyces mirabilis TaxID=68239 RepID=UPI0036E601E3
MTRGYAEIAVTPLGGTLSIDDLADAAWDRELNDLFLRTGHRFGRADLRRRMRDYVRALLGPVGRKNGWVRHEAPCDRVEVEDLYRRAVAAAG